MIYNLMASGWERWVFVGVMVLLFGGWFAWSVISSKKRRQESENLLNSIQPGNKVKTIGGICGIVVEVCPEDNTFILETGSENSGKSYIKFDRQAIYQTDATPTTTVSAGETVTLGAKEETEEKEAAADETKAEPFEDVTADNAEKTENVEDAETEAKEEKADETQE